MHLKPTKSDELFFTVSFLVMFIADCVLIVYHLWPVLEQRSWPYSLMIISKEMFHIPPFLVKCLMLLKWHLKYSPILLQWGVKMYCRNSGKGSKKVYVLSSLIGEDEPKVLFFGAFVCQIRMLHINNDKLVNKGYIFVWK